MPNQVTISDAILQDIRTLAATHEAQVLVVGGLNFRTADMRLREKLAFSEDRLPAVLQGMAAHPAVDEVLILSTCNRTEVYIYGDSRVDWARELPALIAAHCRATADELAASLYLHRGESAAQHLFRVASGLDSMVIGEYEIVRQLKCAVTCARDAETSSVILQRLAEKALAASKRARTQVRYDEYGLSVASLAVTACKRFFSDDLHNRTVLVLGAGETAELTLHYLINKGIGQVLIANRTVQRAEQLARTTGGTALPLSAFPDHLAEADLVICCTSSPDPLITRAMLASALAAQPGKRMLVIDLAMPRDVEPEVAALPGVRLLNLDALQGTAVEIAEQRQQKIQDAEAIIAAEAREFGGWLASRRTITIMRAMQARIERVRTEVSARLADELQLTAQEQAAIIEPQTQALVSGLLREALCAMQEVTGAAEDSTQMTLARRILQPYCTE